MSVIETEPWGIQRELAMRAEAGSGPLRGHEFPAAWEVRAIRGAFNVGVLQEETARTLELLSVLQGNLLRTGEGATVTWPEATRQVSTVSLVHGCDIDALADAVHRPFRLDLADRARAVIATPQEGVGYLLIAIDHIYADGQTISLVYEEVFRGYNARVSGQPGPHAAPSWGVFADVVQATFVAPERGDDRARYFDRMRDVALRASESRARYPVSELRANRHHRTMLSRAASQPFMTASRRLGLPLGEVVAAGMMAVHRPEDRLPVAFARHGRGSSRWYRTPGTAYENLFTAPPIAGASTDDIRLELGSVPQLLGAWPTDYLTSDETYELRRRASSTFPKTRAIRLPGAIVTSDDALFLRIFEYTDASVDQERRYELFIMAWPCDDGRIFLNAHVDPRCVPEPARYVEELVTAVSAF